MPVGDAKPSIRRVCALVNPASGGVSAEMVGELARLLAGFGLSHQVTALEPGRFEAMARTAIDSDPDLVVVLGGDGTARSVIELCGPDGPIVAPLSGGTINKLGRALYGAVTWSEALTAALEHGSVRWMSSGQIEGHSFYCRSTVGAPALLGQAREAIRARRLARAVRRTVSASRRARRVRLGYQFGAAIGRGSVIGLISPNCSRAPYATEDALEAAVFDLPNARAGVRVAINNLFRDWREAPNVRTHPFASGRIWANEPITAMLDGEFFAFGRQIQINVRPRAFRALTSVGARPEFED